MDSRTRRSSSSEDDVRRALVRIAHEIVERNPAPARLDGGPRSAIHRRGAIPRPAPAAVLLEELLDAEVPLGDLDIGFYRDDVAAPARRSGRACLAHRLRRGRTHGGDRRRRALHGPHRARRDRGAVRLRPPRARAAGGARRPRPSRAADPAGLRRQEPAHLARRARARARERAGRRRRGGDRALPRRRRRRA